MDLLLDLARAQKVDLAKISILSLVDQYLAVIEGARRVRLELAADWLVMAAWLTWLKSRLLVPAVAADDLESGEMAAEALAARLREMNVIRTLATWLSTRPVLGQDVFARGAPESHHEYDRSRIVIEAGPFVRAYLDAVRRGTRSRTVHASPAVPVDGAGRASPARGSGRGPAGLDDAGAVSARPHGQPHRTPRGAFQHPSGQPGDGSWRDRSAAAGGSIRPDSGSPGQC